MFDFDWGIERKIKGVVKDLDFYMLGVGEVVIW